MQYGRFGPLLEWTQVQTTAFVRTPAVPLKMLPPQQRSSVWRQKPGIRLPSLFCNWGPIMGPGLLQNGVLAPDFTWQANDSRSRYKNPCWWGGRWIILLLVPPVTEVCSSVQVPPQWSGPWWLFPGQHWSCSLRQAWSTGPGCTAPQPGPRALLETLWAAQWPLIHSPFVKYLG